MIPASIFAGSSAPSPVISRKNQAILPTSPGRREAEDLRDELAEKILADSEALPADWPVQGTTGYDFSSLLGGLFVDAQAGIRYDVFLYHRFIGGQPRLCPSGL